MNTKIVPIRKIFMGFLLVATIDFAVAEPLQEGKNHQRIDFESVIKQMQLSDEQREQFTATLKKNHSARNEMKKQFRQATHSKQKAEMAKVLTSDQLDIFHEFMKKQRPKRNSQ
jgi:type III secretory pathway component EscR